MARRTYKRDYDDETSEIYGESDRSAAAVPHWPGEWWRMELATAQLIRQHRKDVTMLDVSVFFYLVENMEDQNIVRDMSQLDIAAALKTSDTAVSRSLRKLYDLGWVMKLAPSCYRIDVTLGWNGIGSDRWKLAKGQDKKPRRKKTYLKPVDGAE